MNGGPQTIPLTKPLAVVIRSSMAIPLLNRGRSIIVMTIPPDRLAHLVLAVALRYHGGIEGGWPKTDDKTMTPKIHIFLFLSLLTTTATAQIPGDITLDPAFGGAGFFRPGRRAPCR